MLSSKTRLSASVTNLHIDIFDEVGIGGGASGVAGGLVHPYSPKVKLLWRGAECWEEALKLLRVAEMAVQSRSLSWNKEMFYETIDSDGPIFWRRGIIRPATKIKILDTMTENARHHLESCKLEVVTNNFVKKLMPDVVLPLNTAFYMPQAVNIHPMRYLQALFFACKDLSETSVVPGNPSKVICFHKKEINSLQELSDAYTAVIVCLGAKSGSLPELSGKLPLRKCRGIVMHMQLPHELKEGYMENAPSILSDAWLAIQGPRDLVIGSTWDWSSADYSSAVTEKEASSALRELIPKASAILPNISNWVFRNAKGGMRAMPPLTELGSLPLLGCLNNLVGGSPKCRYWLLGGLGARGLLYHAWLGKLMAKAVISCDENQLPPELTAWKR
ncbi:unnamed protein product [Victoria cruziana]